MDLVIRMALRLPETQGSGKKRRSSGLPWTGDAFSVTALIGLAGTGVVCMGSGCWIRKRGK